MSKMSQTKRRLIICFLMGQWQFIMIINTFVFLAGYQTTIVILRKLFIDCKF